jgi:hypothetical protein
MYPGWNIHPFVHPYTIWYILSSFWHTFFHVLVCM